jgi:glycerate dehydrogenase
VLCHTVGVDHVDLEACKARDIRVYNSPGCAADTVAEHAIAMVQILRFSLARSSHGR